MVVYAPRHRQPLRRARSGDVVLAALQPGVRFLGGRAVLTRWVSSLRARVREGERAGEGWALAAWPVGQCDCGVGCEPGVTGVCGLWAVALGYTG